MPKVKGLLSFVAAASVGMSVTSMVRAQGSGSPCVGPPPGGTVGPVVIVGDITGPTNYAVAGGLDAFSVGTTSCDPGSVWVNWMQSTAEHPVVGQNLFKLKTINPGTQQAYNTFEQIGQSWLKHTFFALSGNICCTTACISTDGTHLGVSCSDPYTSSRNGTQGSLGPKWQVNAHTGVYVYPFANPSMPNANSRRLLVPVGDLEASGGASNARYFTDCQYVSHDVATAGNHNRSTSYRPATMSGTTDFSMALTGSTVRERPAIYGWQTADPTVTLNTLDSPGDPSGTERFYIASKATNLNNGTWHYEYAVYNQNSDRNGGGFSVPVPDTATVTNIGFKSVAYRDGDGPSNINFDGSAWTTGRSNNTLTWSTTPFATNASANALRWGSMYTFRFDANVAPAASGNVTLTTWKVIASYPVGAQVPAAGSTCYANCDGDTNSPFLTINDFICFQSAFASGASYANCDQSTNPPVLTVNDFVCFQSMFAAGCSAP